MIQNTFYALKIPFGSATFSHKMVNLIFTIQPGGPDIHVDKGSMINLTCTVRYSPEVSSQAPTQLLTQVVNNKIKLKTRNVHCLYHSPTSNGSPSTRNNIIPSSLQTQLSSTHLGQIDCRFTIASPAQLPLLTLLEFSRSCA